MKKLILILMIAFSFACTKEETADIADKSLMKVSSMTKSPTDFGHDTPVFLFWLDTDFAAIAQNPSTQPYLAAWPYSGIDTYNPGKQTYNTGKKYPENDQTVCCTGYFPSTLTVGQQAGLPDWTVLTVPEDNVGLTDVMVVEEHITGKSSSHFETKNPKEPLVFIHAQSKVNFAAKMGTEMAKNRYLRNVRVIIPGKDQFLTSFKWEDGRYIENEVLQDEAYKVTLQDPNPAQLDPNEINMRELGSVYIRPNQDKITFFLEVEMSESITFDSYEIIRTDEPTTLYFHTNGSDITLGEGDEFDINITILYDSFVVTGKKAEWQEGGKIPLPF